MSSKGSFMIRVFRYSRYFKQRFICLNNTYLIILIYLYSEVQRYCWQKISNIGGNHCETIGKSGGKIAERGCVLEESYFKKKVSCL